MQKFLQKPLWLREWKEEIYYVTQISLPTTHCIFFLCSWIPVSFLADVDIVTIISMTGYPSAIKPVAIQNFRSCHSLVVLEISYLEWVVPQKSLHFYCDSVKTVQSIGIFLES